MSQLKGGSSLDHGLNSLMSLSGQMKRICKSEESAIDEPILSVPREVCRSSETLKYDGTWKLSRTATVLENDIEIMMPMSVSKRMPSTSALDDSLNTKHRSSNSVSSCEMALSNSQLDGEESSETVVSRHEEEASDIDSKEQVNVALIYVGQVK